MEKHRGAQRIAKKTEEMAGKKKFEKKFTFAMKCTDMTIETIREITETVESEFGGLNNVQLNWKKDESSWSIGQVLEHLIVSNSRYFNALKKAWSEDYKPTFWERINPFSNYTGKSMVKNLGPVVNKKYVAPMLFRPSKGMISQDVIMNFRKMQDELYDSLTQLKKVGNTQKVITSPVANLVTLRIEDTIDLLIGHEQRHLNQALAIKQSADFPFDSKSLPKGQAKQF